MAMTIVMATMQREKYSHGPSLKAIAAIDWARRAPRIAEKNVPMKLATMPMAKAWLACPFFAIGYPSKTVATDEGEPGMPSRTLPMKAPEQPPTQSEIRNMTPGPRAI